MGSEKQLAAEYEERAGMSARLDYIRPELTTEALRCLLKCAESILVIGRRDLSSETLAAEQRAREAEAGSQALTIEESKRRGDDIRRIHERVTAAVAEPEKAQVPRPYQPAIGDWVKTAKFDHEHSEMVGQVKEVGPRDSTRIVDAAYIEFASGETSWWHFDYLDPAEKPNEAGSQTQLWKPKQGDWVQTKYNPQQDGGLHADVCDDRKKYDGRAGIVGFAYGGESGPYYNRHAVNIDGREVWYHVSELSPLDPALHVSNGRGDVETCLRCHAVIADRFNGPCEPRPCDQALRENAVKSAHELALKTAAKIAEPVDADDRGPREAWGRVNDATITAARALEGLAVAVSRVEPPNFEGAIIVLAGNNNQPRVHIRGSSVELVRSRRALVDMALPANVTEANKLAEDAMVALQRALSQPFTAPMRMTVDIQPGMQPHALDVVPEIQDEVEAHRETKAQLAEAEEEIRRLESEQGPGYEALSRQVSGIAKTLTAAGYACNGGPISIVVERVLADLKQAREHLPEISFQVRLNVGRDQVVALCRRDNSAPWTEVGAFDTPATEPTLEALNKIREEMGSVDVDATAWIESLSESKTTEPERFARCCVAGVVRNSKSQILLIRSKKEGRAWELPGGKIKEGEGWREAFKREIEEETGLTPRAVGFGTVLDGTPKPGAVFTSVILIGHANADGEPKAGDDAAEARWFDIADVPVNELSDLQTSDYLRELVEHEMRMAQYARQLNREGDPLLDRDQEGAPLYVDKGCDECGLVGGHAPTCSVKTMLDRKAILAEVGALPRVHGNLYLALFRWELKSQTEQARSREDILRLAAAVIDWIESFDAVTGAP